jgi:hypothetical protein
MRSLIRSRSACRNSDVQMRKLPSYKKAFRTEHLKMDNDPDVWQEVETVILHAGEQE